MAVRQSTVETIESRRSPSPPSTDSGRSSSNNNNNNNNTTKRTASSGGLDSNGNPKPVKRRAAKACAACRARKVRCDVMQRYHITPDGNVTCSNCQMDGITCVIEESKRRKKNVNGQPVPPEPPPGVNGFTGAAWNHGLPLNNPNSDARRWSGSGVSNEGDDPNPHVPHSIYQNVSKQLDKDQHLRRTGYINQNPPFDPESFHTLLTSAAPSGDRTRSRLEDPPSIQAGHAVPPLKHILPGYLKALPQRMTSVDIDYLFAKGSLSLPHVSIRNALLRSYVEYVHPYMPLVEIHDVLQIIDDSTGESGKMSLLLFQAIMFAGTAFVDLETLRVAGFSNRKAARKAFFQKARVLYDFDYEIDRVALVQSLLLMTYWYETPDDQKDTWHWMGVAISLAHTIGLHRDPAKSNMDPSKKKLWKRIWWSCFMRDRLVALGMRRPTRVKEGDYDVPMLTVDDFEISPIAESNTIITSECTIARDVVAQRELALMCIAKAELCLCISQVLSAQYSVLVKHQGMQSLEGSTRSSVMLIPKKLDQSDEVERCDVSLKKWFDDLPECCQYKTDMPANNSGPPLMLHRSLLHMVYFTTLSALHRPQVLPSATTAQPDSSREVQDLSRKKVREASREITRISRDLHQRGLEKYLPTTGVTVLLPAIIIHLLDIKSCNDDARRVASDGFCQCMQVLQRLRDNYASADFAVQFLEAAIRKAGIDVMIGDGIIPTLSPEDVQATLHSERVRELRERSKLAAQRNTPPPIDTYEGASSVDVGMGYVMVQESDNTPTTGSMRTPPDEESSIAFTPVYVTPIPGTQLHMHNHVGESWDTDMTEYFDFEILNEASYDEGVVGGIGWHGESGGLLMDMGMDLTDHTMRWSRAGSPNDMFEDVSAPSVPLVPTFDEEMNQG